MSFTIAEHRTPTRHIDIFRHGLDPLGKRQVGRYGDATAGSREGELAGDDFYGGRGVEGRRPGPGEADTRRDETPAQQGFRVERTTGFEPATLTLAR